MLPFCDCGNAKPPPIIPDEEISGSKHFVNPSDATTIFQFLGRKLILAIAWSLGKK
jgi:hypothetical protein